MPIAVQQASLLQCLEQLPRDFGINGIDSVREECRGQRLGMHRDPLGCQALHAVRPTMATALEVYMHVHASKIQQVPRKPPVAEASLGAASFQRILAPAGVHTMQISLSVIGG